MGDVVAAGGEAAAGSRTWRGFANIRTTPLASAMLDYLIFLPQSAHR